MNGALVRRQIHQLFKSNENIKTEIMGLGALKSFVEKTIQSLIYEYIDKHINGIRFSNVYISFQVYFWRT